ncbi:unnamed protein product [Mytilus coruscus]|uniref:Uncharacterized protein n=1 Tax=Mytilus coruscus TaxID=42192 RepID=A0A6J8E3X2_MYTCO|nr:unnamed protein product [Mytilus coruscus]
MLLEINDSTFWISGDLNLLNIDWTSMTIEGKMYPKEMNEIFLDLLNNLGMDQLVNFPTRKDNILDIFCTKQPNLITKIKSIPGISDHNIVLVDAICMPKRATQCPHKIFLWKKVDLEKIKNIIKSFIYDLLSQTTLELTIDQWWIKFRDGIIKIINENIYIYQVK